MADGRKYDDGKPDYASGPFALASAVVDRPLRALAEPVRVDLIPPRALAAVHRVLEFGAAKYGDRSDNWRRVADMRRRYQRALLRHDVAYAAGELRDPETGEHPLAHLICDAMFLIEVDP